MAEFSEWQADIFEDFLAGTGDGGGGESGGVPAFLLGEGDFLDSVTMGNLLSGAGGMTGKDAAENLFRNPPQIVHRNVTVFLIDCSASMFTLPLLPSEIAAPPPSNQQQHQHHHGKPFHQGQTPFSRAVSFARKFYEHSVLSNASSSSGGGSNKDLMAVVLFNTRESLNQYNFPGIFVFQDFDSPSAPRVQELDTLAKTGIFIIPNQQQQPLHNTGSAAATSSVSASTSGVSSVYAQKYEEFRTHIGHCDVDSVSSSVNRDVASVIKAEHHGDVSGGAFPISNSGISGAAKKNAVCKLSDVLWNVQHMFHFLKSSAQNSGIVAAAASSGKAVLYQYQKNVMIFTDKEDPIRTYATVLTTQNLVDQLVRDSPHLFAGCRSSTTGSAASPLYHQRFHEILQKDQKSMMIYLRKVSEFIGVERVKCESRIRDLLEDGANIEVLGYTSSAVAGNGANSTTTAARKLPTFDPRRCWGPLLRSPYTAAVAATALSAGNQQGLNHSASAGGSYPLAQNQQQQQHSSSSLSNGGVVPDSHAANLQHSYGHNPHAPTSHAVASASAPASSEKVVLDWFATLGGDNIFTASGGSSTSTPADVSGRYAGSSASTSQQQQQHVSGSKRARSPGSDSGSSSHATSVVPSSYAARGNHQTGGSNNNSAAVAVEVHDEGKCRARVLVFDRGVYKGMPKPPHLPGGAQDDDDDEDFVDDEASHFFDSLTLTRTYLQRPVGSLTMSFGPLSGISNHNNNSSAAETVPTLAVQLYLPVVKCQKPRFTWRHATTNDAVVTKQKRIGKSTGEEVPPTGKLVEIAAEGVAHSPNERLVKRVLYAGNVGGRRVLFSETEKQVIRSGTFLHPNSSGSPKGSASVASAVSTTHITSAGHSATSASVSGSNVLSHASVRILCTKPYDVAVRNKYSVGRSGFLHPQSLPPKLAASVVSSSSVIVSDGTTTSKSALLEAEASNVKLFVGLHRILLEKGLVAIAELSSVRRTAPHSGSSLNGQGNAEDPAGISSDDGGHHDRRLPNEAYQSAPRLVALVPAKLPSDQLDGIVPHPIYSTGAANFITTAAVNPIIPVGFYQSIQSVGGCGFHVIPLPYADDIRSLETIKRQFQAEDPRQVNPTKHAQLVQAAGAIIKKLTAPYSPSDLPNPALSHSYAMLQRLALMQDDEDEDDGDFLGHYLPTAEGDGSDDDNNNGNTTALFPTNSKVSADILKARRLKKKRLERQNMSDLTLPDTVGMGRYQSLFIAFSSVAFPPHYDPTLFVPPPAGSGTATNSSALSTSEKATVAANEIKGMDFDQLEKNGTLGKLTIPLLAAYLKSEGAQSSGKKQDLVDAVTKIIRKKRLTATASPQQSSVVASNQQGVKSEASAL